MKTVKQLAMRCFISVTCSTSERSASFISSLGYEFYADTGMGLNDFRW